MEQQDPKLEEVLSLVESEAGPAVRNEIAALLREVPKEQPEPKAKNKVDESDMRQAINNMNMAEKIKTAMLGNAVCRKLLIFDPSRMIQECVLSNPMLAPNEIEEFARSTTIDAQVLRSIAGRSTWIKSYTLKLTLVNNPKSPLDLSLKWLKFLQERDIKGIARSKNIPQALQTAAKKLLDK